MHLGRSIPATILAFLLAFGAPTIALSCTPASGYIRPSNFELVQIADAIVVATPVSERIDQEFDWRGSVVRFRVTEVLKGDVANEVDVAGQRLGRTRASDPDNILFSHPEGHQGPCNRVTVSKDGRYVLFLRRYASHYAALSFPFSRVSEDYAGEDALWTRVVRAYLAVQNGQAPMAQVAKLEAMRTALLAAPRPTRGEQAFAADIDGHLGSLSPWKPTEFLLAALADHKAGRPPRYKPRPGAFDGEQSEAAALTALIADELSGGRPPVAEPRADPFETRLIEMLIDGDHPAAMPLFETFARPDASPGELAMAIRFFAKNGRYPEAYRLVEARAVGLMATASEGDFNILSYAIGDAQQDPFYGEGQPRWRTDPEIAARWPKLALKLTMIGDERFGEHVRYKDTLLAQLGTDYRADPDLTLMLSGHSNAITDWAKRELAKPENLAASAGDVGGTAADPLLLPLKIELRWAGVGGGDDIPELARVFCLGAAQRRAIFELWGRLGSTHGALVLLRLAASPSVDADDLRVLTTAIPAWDARYKSDRGKSWLAADEAMRKLAEGRPITASDVTPLRPVTCAG